MPIRLIFLLFVLLFAGCASLPSDVQRTTTTALAKEATESTYIGHEVTALANQGSTC